MRIFVEHCANSRVSQKDVPCLLALLVNFDKVNAWPKSATLLFEPACIQKVAGVKEVHFTDLSAPTLIFNSCLLKHVIKPRKFKRLVGRT